MTQAAREAKIVVVGAGRRADGVAECLGNEAVKVVRIPDIRNLENSLGQEVVGVVFVEPILGVRRGLETIATSSKYSEIPVHVAATDMVSDDHARDLYKRGAASVIAFPREKNLFAKIVCDVKLSAKRVGRGPVKPRIIKALQARIKAMKSQSSRIKLWFENGIIYPIGRVKSLRKKEQLEKIIASAPGVEKVVDSGLEVPLNSETDREIEDRVNHEILRVKGVRLEAVTCSVNDGNVVLAGTVADKSSLLKLNSRIFNIFGVRSFRNLAAVSPEEFKADVKLAVRLRKKLRKMFKRDHFEVTVMKNVAVIKGEVKDPAKKPMVEAVVRAQSPISKVVNKVCVSC
jgi:osmotically-inducible protein OsmY